MVERAYNGQEVEVVSMDMHMSTEASPATVMAAATAAMVTMAVVAVVVRLPLFYAVRDGGEQERKRQYTEISSSLANLFVT
jgi:hypothetical protein